jgi:hypothetical protein
VAGAVRETSRRTTRPHRFLATLGMTKGHGAPRRPLTSGADEAFNVEWRMANAQSRGRTAKTWHSHSAFAIRHSTLNLRAPESGSASHRIKRAPGHASARLPPHVIPSVSEESGWRGGAKNDIGAPPTRTDSSLALGVTKGGTPHRGGRSRAREPGIQCRMANGECTIKRTPHERAFSLSIRHSPFDIESPPPQPEHRTPPIRPPLPSVRKRAPDHGTATHDAPSCPVSCRFVLPRLFGRLAPHHSR